MATSDNIKEEPDTVQYSITCNMCDNTLDLCNCESYTVTHAEEKPHQCTVCEKRFTKSGKLNKHMKIHNQEKPYQCKICEKMFTTSFFLKQHSRTHKGEKPYQV